MSKNKERGDRPDPLMSVAITDHVCAFLRVAGPHSSGLPDRLTGILSVNSCLIPHLIPFHMHVDSDFEGHVTSLHLCR